MAEPIKKVSDKRKEQLDEYRPERDDFLKQNPLCQANVKCKAGTPSSELHHMEGRENGLLLDKDKWLALCTDCHGEFTKNSKEAIESGHSLSRHKKNK